MLASLWWPVIALICRLSTLAADKTVTVVTLIEWFVKCGFIPALEDMRRNMFSSVLWPRGLAQYHTSSFAGSKELLALRGLWNRLLHSGLRWERYSRSASLDSVLSQVFRTFYRSTRHLCLQGLLDDFSWRTLHLALCLLQGTSLQSVFFATRACAFSVDAGFLGPSFQGTNRWKTRQFAAIYAAVVNRFQRARPLRKALLRLPLSRAVCAL